MAEPLSGQELEEARPDIVGVHTFTLFRKKLWPYVSRYRALFFWSLVCILASTVFAIAAPWLMGVIVDRVLVPKRADLVVISGIALLIVSMLRALGIFVQTWMLTLVGQKVLHDLRQDLLKQYQFYPIGEFNKTPAGRMVTRLVNDTSSLQDLFTGGVAVALADVLVIIGMAVCMIVLHLKLGLLCLTVFPLMIFSAHYFGDRIRATFREARAALSRLNAYLAENISGMWLIQIFNRQKDFRSKFDAVSKSYTSRQLDTVQMFSYFQPSITILGAAAMSILIWAGGYRAVDGTVTLGLLVTFMSYLQGMYTPIRDLTEKYNLFVSAMASCEKIFEFLDRPLETNLDATIAHPKRVVTQGAVEFEDVWFRYDEKSDWVLKGVSFAAGPGERIGIVGHTGAGKTTITALLMRWYDATKGTVRIDARDVRAWDKRSVRDSIGYIQQEPFLFSGTIADNIFLWQPHRRDVFDRLPPFAREPFTSGRLHLDQIVVEKGANLSAGERQIVAFLRALVQDPRMLILDEATAHVDLLTEQWVSRVSEEAFRSRTVFVIAHRLATLKTVDRILVMHKGELVEQGTHRELLARGGVYARLYEIQSRKEELEG